MSASTIAEMLPIAETVAPVDEAAVAAAVRDALAAELPIYPVGGGTRLDYGLRPSRPGIALSLAKLKEVIDYPADDMTITVQAGLTMAELAKRLAEKGQRLPIDVGQPRRATVGGVVATGLSGPRRYACGTIRDLVIGIRAVDGLGRVFSAGGRVLKNAAGYNLCRLLVGSLGTLAVVTQVTLMVRPLPESSALVAAELSELEAAEQLLADLNRGQTLPAAVELLAGSALQDVPALARIHPPAAARLIVGFEGSRAEVEWMVRRLDDQWSRQGVSSPTAVRDSRAGPLWDWLAEFPAAVQISVPPGKTVETVGQVLNSIGGAAIQAHAGNGVIRVGLPPSAPDQFRELTGGRLRAAAAAAGGKMVVLSCPDGAGLSREDLWGPPGDGAAMMLAVKDRFDPKGLLNPGRFSYTDR